MKNFLLHIIILNIFCCLFVNAQETDTKSSEIIKKAKSTIFKKEIETKSCYLEYSSNYRSSKERKNKGYVDFTYQAKLWFEYFPKIKFKRLASYPKNQQELFERILNSDDYSERKSIKTDDQGFSELAFTPNGDPKKIKEQNVANLKYVAFTSIFPILFKFEDNLKFSYVGVAKSKNQEANVIETGLSDQYKIKIFFDSKTNLPIMLIADFYDEILKKDIEQKFFYSDFKEENQLFYAHKIIIQENNEVVEEREIKTVTLNPDLKSDFFEIKK